METTQYTVTACFLNTELLTLYKPINWGLALRSELLAPNLHLNPPAPALHQCHSNTDLPSAASDLTSHLHSSLSHMALQLRVAEVERFEHQHFANIPACRTFCWRDFLWPFMPTWYNYYCSALTGCVRWTWGQRRN